MRKTILISVGDVGDGYGDFLFALKLASQIKAYYCKIFGTDNAPEIMLFTMPKAKNKILELKGNDEFNVKVLTPSELLTEKRKGMTVASILEGPVADMNLIALINLILQDRPSHLNHDGEGNGNSLPTPEHPSVPLTLIPEYAFSTGDDRIRVEGERSFRQQYSKIHSQGVIYTGLNNDTNEKGIILSHDLVDPPAPAILTAQLDLNIREGLLKGKEIKEYQENTEMYFQYSHDTLRTTSHSSTAKRFLQLHRIYVQSSSKNQDVLMVGKSKASKREALDRVKNQLVKDGYAKISFYDADTQSEQFLHGSADTLGKSYRVVYKSAMSHRSSIAAQALSGDLIGATGDQSLGEAISGSKTIVYECRIHKQALHNDYYAALKKSNPDCKEVLTLLQEANSEAEYKRLGELLTPGMKLKLKGIYQKFRASSDLIHHAAIAAMPADLLEQSICKGNIDPYGDGKDLSSPFERVLIAKKWDAIKYIIINHTNDIKKQDQFCNLLIKPIRPGCSYIKDLRAEKPEDPVISRASYLVARFQIEKYQDKRNAKRAAIADAFKELFSIFDSLGTHNESALIGLILLAMKHVAKEYSFLSPRRGIFFGSQFYSHLEDALTHLGIDLKTITATQRKNYYEELAKMPNNKSKLFDNSYFLQMLSEEVNLGSHTPLEIIDGKESVAYVEAKLIKLGQVKKHAEISGIGEEYIAESDSFLAAVTPYSRQKTAAATESDRAQLRQALAKSIVDHQSKETTDPWEMRVYKALSRVKGCTVTVVDKKQTLEIAPEMKETEPKLPPIMISCNEDGSYEPLTSVDLLGQEVVEAVTRKPKSESMAGIERYGFIPVALRKRGALEHYHPSLLLESHQ